VDLCVNIHSPAANVVTDFKLRDRTDLRVDPL
jgi:hypothetical protein